MTVQEFVDELSSYPAESVVFFLTKEDLSKDDYTQLFSIEKEYEDDSITINLKSQ